MKKLICLPTYKTPREIIFIHRTYSSYLKVSCTGITLTQECCLFMPTPAKLFLEPDSEILAALARVWLCWWLSVTSPLRHMMIQIFNTKQIRQNVKTITILITAYPADQSVAQLLSCVPIIYFCLKVPNSLMVAAFSF